MFCRFTSIETFLAAKGWRALAVPGDGHCLLHSVAKAMNEDSTSSLKSAIWAEITSNASFYEAFSESENALGQVRYWLTHKNYNLSTVDLALNVDDDYDDNDAMNMDSGNAVGDLGCKEMTLMMIRVMMMMMMIMQ